MYVSDDSHPPHFNHVKAQQLMREDVALADATCFDVHEQRERERMCS